MYNADKIPTQDKSIFLKSVGTPLGVPIGTSVNIKGFCASRILPALVLWPVLGDCTRLKASFMVALRSQVSS